MLKKMLLAGALLASAGAANAAVVVSFTGGAPAPSGGFTVVYDFDTTLPGAPFATGPLVQIKSPPADGNGAPPANSSPSGTDYLSVLGGGVAQIDFAGPVSAFQFDWGSLDSYNTLTILMSGGMSEIEIPGTTFTNAADGNQVAPGTNGLFTVSGNAGETFTGFRLASSSNSFEIDNVAVSGAVPEPATWGFMILGFGAVGAAVRRRKDALRHVLA